MSCVLHLLNASGRLDPWRAILEKTFTDALPPEHCDELHRVLTNILAAGVLRPRTDQEHCL